MKTMAVAWNGTTLNDKVKLLSVTEIGYSHQYAVVEGNRYYEYGPHIKNVVYWLRTHYTNATGYAWCVYDSGYVTTGDYYYGSYCLTPVIRLG